MQNKYIFHIAFANLLWSLIPIIVVDLFDELSIILIVFYRFFFSGLILLLLAFLLVFINNRNPNKKPIRIRELFDFILKKNVNFFNMKNLYYYGIMGFFGIILQIVWFFLTIKATSIAFAMMGFIISIVIVAIYEHEVKSEKLDVFKILYLILLILSIGIIIYVRAQEMSRVGSEISLIGILYLILFSISLSFFNLAAKRDSYSKEEIKIINKNKNYKIPRLLIKISVTFLFGILLMIPFLIIFYLLPIKSDLSTEIGLFFIQVFELQHFFRWEILFLVIFATITPYIFIFIAQAKWTAFNLTYSQWASILTIIEPIGSIFFSFILINEYFPLPFLVIVLFLLIISILLRYAHETINKVNAYVLLEKKTGNLKTLPLELLKLDGVCCVNSLIGTHDILVHVRTNSITKFYHLIDFEIRKMEGINSFKILFINKVCKYGL